MQGHHLLPHPHQQQQLQHQLAGLLSAALPQPGPAAVDADSASPSISSRASLDETEKRSESDRVAAIESLQRAIVHPPNALVVAHSAAFLSQGFSQLLSDRSYPVRRAAAVAYGSLSTVVCALPLSSNGGIADRFIGWALPLIKGFDVENGSSELAVLGLKQFLLDSVVSNCTVVYVLQILKSLQDLLEDERTSFELLSRILSVLTIIASKYEQCIQPHFVDIIDVLLGWALVPDLSEQDRKILTESFMQLKNQWIGNLPFSFNLLSKFLGDMEVLVQDNGNLGNSQQSGRLIALFCCFSSVIQVTASGVLEKKLQTHVSEPLEGMCPRLFCILLVVGKKLEWDKWVEESWRCIVLLAEVLQEKFSKYYETVIDILFQSLGVLPSSLLQKVLKENQKVLSLLKLELLPSSVHKILQFGLPFSDLRLHPNRLVVVSVASTYLLIVNHDCNGVVSRSISLLIEELKLLKNMLLQEHDEMTGSILSYSESKLISLIKFDLSMVICSFSLGYGDYSLKHEDFIASHNERSTKLVSFVLENFDIFQSPIQDILELQVYIVKGLRRLSKIEIQSRLILFRSSGAVNERPHSKECPLSLFVDHLKKYDAYVVRLLCESSPLAVKLEALEFLCSLCRIAMKIHCESSPSPFCESYKYVGLSSELLWSVLKSASDREVKVRSRVASVLELLLQTRLIFPESFGHVAEVTLDRLGDHDAAVKSSFVRLLCTILPVTTYLHGIFGPVVMGSHGFKDFILNWKHLLALRKMPRQLRSQQFLTVLSYISQRSKVQLSSWVQRLAFSCHILKDPSASHHKETEAEHSVLDRICPVNDIAAIWWSTHEAARLCVDLRLRTSLGGPAQTFAALERMLLDVSQVLLLDVNQREEGLNIGSSHIHLLPMRLLLDFVESLKKNVYNAYEGSCVLPYPRRQSYLFFRANRKVCEEWFSRICDPMLNASLALHCHHATFYYSGSRLQELQNLISSSFRERNQDNFLTLKGKFSTDVMKLLRDASLALTRSHEPETLVGLHNWAVMAFSPLFTDGYDDSVVHFSWMMGLVYEAYGQYEKAAVHFSHLLRSEVALSSMGSDGIQFSIARIIECYTEVSDWKSLELWLSELQMLRTTHAGKAFCGALTTAGCEMNAVHALARFDEGDIQGSWGYLDLTPKSSNELTLDLRMGLERSGQMLLRAMLLIDQKDKMLEELNKAEIMLNDGISIICLDGFSEAVPYAMQLHCISALKDNSKFFGGDQSKQPLAQLNTLYHVLQFPIYNAHQDCSAWLKVLRVYRTLMPSSPATLFLCKRLLDLARKQSNFMLADCMVQYLNNHMSMCWQGDQLNLFSDALTYERIRLDYSMGNHEVALVNLWSFILPEITAPESPISETDNMLKAKALLKLSAWLKQDHLIPNIENVIYKMQGDLENISPSLSRKTSLCRDDNLHSNVNWDMLLEEIVGMAAKLSHIICPCLCKTWFHYASWCYNQARNSFDSKGTVLQSCTLSSILLSEVLPDRFALTEEETTKVENLLKRVLQHKGHKTNSVDFGDEILLNSLVHQVAYLMQSAAGAPGIEHSDDECPSNVLTYKLQMFLERTNPECEKDDTSAYTNELVDIWWSLRRRRVSLFGKAAHGYLQYLSLSSSKTLERPNNGSEFTFANEKPGNCTLGATLNILQILLNYGVELKETLGPGLARVPVSPWQEIIPQLFSRLSSHPQKAVREELEGLLMMLAKRSPWSIVYPALVDANASSGKSSEELGRILACLTRLYPKLMLDVQLIISELGSITVLWEDQWLSTLQDLHPDVMKRINTLKEEAVRIKENTTLSHSEKNKINAAKYSAMMAPVVVALERRLASTSREPETPHEVWFQKEYSELLKSAIISFKTPPASALNLGDIWKTFDSITASLLAYQRKSLVSLSEVAPRLSLLRSSDAPMPGLDIESLVTVSSLCENLVILSTKTRPKKLVFVGSDGKEHTYLLKGREDLRLDARIMQLLQAVDRFLRSSYHTHGRSLTVRYYSVTPINGMAGLIQWVDQVISIYSVYRSWQTRVQFSHLTTVSGENLKNNEAHVPRPGDMFYGKIIPALKEKGIRKVVSRRDWPHDVKRKVLLELMKETPRQLLHQEFWCTSEGFKAFFARSKRFSGTVAVMSMVGYILGLGDRHLDNILLDFSTGDVVHIDYNVCFDKGKRLKIPEIVPFRLTQTIEAALGLTGIEGIFKTNCEAVLDIIRKNKDVILLLLEAFVWDPLVEWTRGDAQDEAVIGGEEKKGMELAVSLSLFASRFQEVRVPLQEHHDLLLSTLPASESALEKFLDVLNCYEIVSANFFQTDKDRLSLLQHEISAKSILAEATSFSENVKSSFEAQAHEFSKAKAVVMEKAQESAKWLEHHGRILVALRSGSVDELQSLVKPIGSEEALSITSSVSAASVPLSIVPEPTQAQCYDIDRGVSRTVAELSGGLVLAVDALQEYAMALQRVLPLNYITTSPVHHWAQILQLSVNSLSPDLLSLSRRQAGELLAKGQDGIPDSIKQRHEELALNVDQYASEIERIRSECSLLVNSLGSDTERKSKDRLLTSFTKYMRSVGYGRLDAKKDSKLHGDLVDKATKALSVLQLASNELFKGLKNKVSEFLDCAPGEECLHLSSKRTPFELEEHIEKCALLVEFSREIRGMMGVDLPDYGMMMDDVNWVSVFQDSIKSGKNMIDQMLLVVLPEVITSVISYYTEVMEAFGSLSQIRGTVDTVLEQLIEIELERASLVELEENYIVKVGDITEKKLALEEAFVKGRENLSWEEAEELASQEEVFRVQLDQLHKNWNQKDEQRSDLKKRELNVINSLLSSEKQLLSLLRTEEGSPQNGRSKALISMLIKPFSELESFDQIFSSYGVHPGSSPFNVTCLIDSGHSTAASIWKLSNINLLKNHSFFIWKICVLDSFLDSCIRDITSTVEHNMGFEQIYRVMKKKLSVELHGKFNLYLRERLAPALMLHLEREDEISQRVAESSKEMYQWDLQAVKRVQKMLEEYCDALESFRAVKSTVSHLKYQANELSESLQKTVLELIQMEWLHDQSLPYQHKIRELSQNIIPPDKLSPAILNLRRHKFLEKMQSSMSSITSSLDHLKACERTSAQIEAQLERAMSWACAGPTTVNSGSSSGKNSGIPPGFHEHLLNRRQLLWAVQEQASNIISICKSVIAFEASRDGLFRTTGDTSPWKTTEDSKIWQKTYLNSLTKLEAISHSFTRAEQDWRLAQSSLSTAANSLLIATNELSIASAKAKSASGDLQSTLAALRDSAYEASAALSAFSHVSKSHNALTLECGNMLEEVLAITEGVHDVYGLGKEAAALHAALMADLSKASAILLPLEASLSTDVAALSDGVISREREVRADLSPMHGQALYTFYYFTLRESCQLLSSLVPMIIHSLKELHNMFTKLAKTASHHAGKLHKAFEGLGESQVARSQEFSLSSAEIRDVLFEGKNEDGILEISRAVESSSQDDAWISPPDSIYSSSPSSVLTSSEEQSSALTAGELTNSIPSSTDDGLGQREPTGIGRAYSLEKEDCKELGPVGSENESLNLVKESQLGSRVIRGKNPYAVSVLKQVECKLDGRELDEKRPMAVAEQVDYLLKQATSVDNLCSMYEGWTPWI